MTCRSLVRALAALAGLAVLDALLFAVVLGLMRAGNADFSCAFTCTVGESVGRGLLRLTIVGGGLLAAAAIVAVLIALFSVVFPGDDAARRGNVRDDFDDRDG